MPSFWDFAGAILAVGGAAAIFLAVNEHFEPGSTRQIVRWLRGLR